MTPGPRFTFDSRPADPSRDGRDVRTSWIARWTSDILEKVISGHRKRAQQIEYIAMNNRFYDELAESYHLIFQDWDASIHYQAEVLARLLPPPSAGCPVLDCACGIGTQAIGLAMRGHRTEGSDPSEASIRRATHEAAARGVAAEFRVDDMRSLSTAQTSSYEAVIAMDNAIPHLQSDDDIQRAFTSMRARLRSGGVLLVSLRDYGPLLAHRATGTPASFYWDGKFRRIVHQVWDWQDDRRYVVHLFITCERDDGWQTRHFMGHYRAVIPSEVAQLVERVGFKDVHVLPPQESGYYQPIIRGVAP
jgi:glycine/sarcosine N-methyltransferase